MIMTTAVNVYSDTIVFIIFLLQYLLLR